MFRFSLVAASAVVILASTLFGKVIRVPAQSATIQAGISSSKNGDTVLVAPGIYFENIKFRGKKIILASNFLLDHNPATIRATIIDGSHPATADSASVVLFNSTEDSTTVLTGFTLTNGVGTLVPGSFLGGGILVTAGSSPTISYNIIHDNSAVVGGGIAVRYGLPLIAHNAIANNSAHDGGGIYLENGKVTLTHNDFYGNFADSAGGAFFVKNSLVTFVNNAVTDNSAPRGGGIFCDSGLWDIENCNFYRNFGGNFSGCGDSGLGDNRRARNFNLDSADSFQNIFFEPLYVNPAAHDFSLSCQSRLIDAGAGLPEGYPVGGSRSDIGMLEYPFRVGDLNLDGKVNVADITYLINIIFYNANLPCPLYTADADCDRMITIADAIAMIHYWMGISQTSCLFDLQ